MEKKDYSTLSKIELKELQIKFIDTKLLENYSEIFNKLNITTLKDLLIANDKGFFDNRKTQENVTIKGMCDLLKYIYLKEPLEQGIHLEDKIGTKENPFLNSLRRLGLTKKEEMIIRIFYANQNINFKTIRVIDILNLFFNNTSYQEELIYKTSQTQSSEYVYQETLIINNLNAKILYLTNYYKKQYRNTNIEELNLLKEKRKEIKKQIEQLKQQLEEIEYKMSINGIYPDDDLPLKNHK